MIEDNVQFTCGLKTLHVGLKKKANLSYEIFSFLLLVKFKLFHESRNQNVFPLFDAKHTTLTQNKFIVCKC